LEVRVHPERSANSTHPFVLRTIHTLHVLGERSCGGAVVRKARFDVTERLAHVLERNRRGEPVQRYAGSQGLPPHTLPTEGVSVEAIPPLTAKIASAISRSSQMSVVRAIERLVGGLFPLVTGPCDPGDYGTFAEARGGRLAWYLYDAVQGGIGLAVQAYARIPDLLTKALDRVTGCGCAEDGGCFRCVRDPEREDPASKSDCAAALERLCGALRGAPPGRRIRGPISIA
jgi:DEAD/DEAH box helicase domain-containing protein